MNDALVDLSGNLLEQVPDNWVTPALEAVNARVDPQITASETVRPHAEDRRPYEFLLPERTTYGEHTTT